MMVMNNSNDDADDDVTVYHYLVYAEHHFVWFAYIVLFYPANLKVYILIFLFSGEAVETWRD